MWIMINDQLGFLFGNLHLTDYTNDRQTNVHSGVFLVNIHLNEFCK